MLVTAGQLCSPPLPTLGNREGGRGVGGPCRPWMIQPKGAALRLGLLGHYPQSRRLSASLTGLGPSGAPSTKVQITKADASTPSSTAAPDTTGSPEPKCDSACVCWVGVISPSLPGQNLRLALGAVEINFKRANPLPIPTCPPLYSLCEIYLRVVPSERQGSGRLGPQAEVGAS